MHFLLQSTSGNMFHVFSIQKNSVGKYDIFTFECDIYPLVYDMMRDFCIFYCYFDLSC